MVVRSILLNISNLPLWIGLFEKNEDGFLFVSKIVFGTEPKDVEVYQWILKHYYHLRFSSAVEHIVKVRHGNPKRMQREVRKIVSQKSIGTKSQQALKLQYEQIKLETSKKNKGLKKLEKQKQFDLKQQKRKEKHRGR